MSFDDGIFLGGLIDSDYVTPIFVRRFGFGVDNVIQSRHNDF